MASDLSHVETWIFDLDNCLYSPTLGLFDLIDERMGAYIQRLLGVDAAEARRVQKAHFHAHGTTLAGLMAEHEVDPHEFLADVHAIALDRLSPDARLERALARLPGRKLIFTNGDAAHAGRVLDRLGIAARFEGLHDIHATGLVPKPDRRGYEALIERFAIRPDRAAMVEDMVQNLAPAKALGMTTIWVDNGSERGNFGHDPAFVDHRIADVGEWLETLTGETS